MAKTEIIKFRCSAADKAAFEKAADMAGVALSVWIMARCRSTPPESNVADATHEMIKPVKPSEPPPYRRIVQPGALLKK